jgi:hypothetical protein
MRKEMTIVAATHGGFLVYDLTTGSKDVQPLFAGDLEACTGFMTQAFTTGSTGEDINDRWRVAYDALLKAQTMGSSHDTPAFLDWLADRLVNVHDEDANVDFVLSLHERAKQGRDALFLHEQGQLFK